MLTQGSDHLRIIGQKEDVETLELNHSPAVMTGVHGVGIKVKHKPTTSLRNSSSIIT